MEIIVKIYIAVFAGGAIWFLAKFYKMCTSTEETKEYKAVIKELNSKSRCTACNGILTDEFRSSHCHDRHEWCDTIV